MLNTARPRRSVLYMPGSNTRALEKARGLPADSLILDLEDAVAADAKAEARTNIMQAIEQGGYGYRELVVRINPLSSPWGYEDLAAASRSKADAVLLPKVESADMIRQAEGIMMANGAGQDMKIWAMMETPLGMLRAEEIAGASPRLGALVMGTSDLAKDLHASHTRDRMPMMTSLGLCLLAARAFGLAILDGVHLDLRDDEGLAYACRQGVELGFDGKTLIHPRTLAIANEVFAPSPDEVDWSRKIIEAHGEAMAQGKGVAVYEGKLIENLHVENAQRIVAMAAAIAERGEADSAAVAEGSGPMSKTNPGNFFEDFALGQELRHATPRSVNDGDRALYQALYGSRFSLQSSDEVARGLGLPAAPLDDLLAFHVVFGKSVPDVSLNAVANLGYASCVFAAPLLAGDTVTTTSRVIGLKENSNGRTGTVYVRSTGVNQHAEPVLDYVRWVMVRKRDAASPAPEPSLPDLPKAVAAADLQVPDWDFTAYDTTRSGSEHLWDDYVAGEKIDHVDAMTIEEAEHQMATRLYQNTAKVHFNQHTEREGRFGRRIVYGGHVISIARALSFNGLANAIKVAAINGGAHTAPSFAGDTIYAWSEVLESVALEGRDDVGALRLRTVATKDQACDCFPLRDADGRYHPAVVLDLDYTVLLPRRR